MTVACSEIDNNSLIPYLLARNTHNKQVSAVSILILSEKREIDLS